MRGLKDLRRARGLGRPRDLRGLRGPERSEGWSEEFERSEGCEGSEGLRRPSAGI